MPGLHRILRSLLALVAGALIGPASQAAAVFLNPGTVAGYIPLTLFGGNTVIAAGDETIHNIDVATFKFAGQDWTRIGISSNGYIIVGGGTAADVQAVNTNLPDTSAPRNLLAPFWTDLDPTQGGSILVNVLTDGVGVWTVVDWNGVADADGTGASSFEVWIGTNGFEEIAFSYGSVTAGSDGKLTVGAQDASGTVGAVTYFNGTGVLPTLGGDLMVVTRDLPVTVTVPEPASLLLAGVALGGLAAVRRRRA